MVSESPRQHSEPKAARSGCLRGAGLRAAHRPVDNVPGSRPFLHPGFLIERYCMVARRYVCEFGTFRPAVDRSALRSRPIRLLSRPNGYHAWFPSCPLSPPQKYGANAQHGKHRKSRHFLRKNKGLDRPESVAGPGGTALLEGRRTLTVSHTGAAILLGSGCVAPCQPRMTLRSLEDP
jgi:hypothetical protein